ncbi:MAG: hypothetical protein M3Q07_26820, partial [Pseudobdellovibrionaceae bacterium]|nr:hypothetical protein [Pseudobdellovibrionaceae bacterium]
MAWKSAGPSAQDSADDVPEGHSNAEKQAVDHAGYLQQASYADEQVAARTTVAEIACLDEASFAGLMAHPEDMSVAARKVVLDATVDAVKQAAVHNRAWAEAHPGGACV